MATLLLIEDDVSLARMYTLKFEKHGYKVLHAANGEEGLTLATTNKVDLILLDMMIPKISGDMLLQNLRQHPNGTHVPVIVLSNLADQSIADRVKTLGAKEYLTKAMFTPEEVVQVVQKYLPAEATAEQVSESTPNTNPQK